MVTWEKRVRENSEYYELSGTGEKIQEYGDLRYKGEKEQRVLWTKRKRWENTKSMVTWDTRVRENKVYYDLREKSEREQRVFWFERKRWEITKSTIILEQNVRENSEYYDLREKVVREQIVL